METVGKATLSFSNFTLFSLSSVHSFPFSFLSFFSFRCIRNDREYFLCGINLSKSSNQKLLRICNFIAYFSAANSSLSGTPPPKKKSRKYVEVENSKPLHTYMYHSGGTHVCGFSCWKIIVCFMQPCFWVRGHWLLNREWDLYLFLFSASMIVLAALYYDLRIKILDPTPPTPFWFI